ncbi:ABC transporter permease [Aneurinibacillus aneurinilyticus]|jgi:ABC-2 type transport system permease protein|uniref:ABC transporter permease n=1 Tax=Aneurinibacillus aneurinilyticus TaxID=1391 RepID=UPI003525E15B
MTITAAISSESLKYRRTLSLWLIIGGPFTFALMQMLFGLLMPGGVDWSHALMNVYNWWAVFGLPFGITLLTTLSVAYERRSGAWRVLRTYPLQAMRLYMAKLIVLVAQTLAACLLFTIFIAVLCSFTVTGAMPWSELLQGFAVAWLTSLALVAFMLLAAHLLGFGWTVMTGLAGIFLGIVTGNLSVVWVPVPWQWPIRALGALFGFQTNGLPQESSSPLLDPSLMVTGSLWSLLGCVVLTAIGAWWFHCKEVR